MLQNDAAGKGVAQLAVTSAAGSEALASLVKLLQQQLSNVPGIMGDDVKQISAELSAVLNAARTHQLEAGDTQLAAHHILGALLTDHSVSATLELAGVPPACVAPYLASHRWQDADVHMDSAAAPVTDIVPVVAQIEEGGGEGAALCDPSLRVAASQLVPRPALLDGLVQRIVKSDVPSVLRGSKLVSLDVGALAAGASRSGDTEARLRALLTDVVDSAAGVVLAVGDACLFVGDGNIRDAMDAAGLLRHWLAGTGLRCVGATTLTELRQHMGKAVDIMWGLLRSAACVSPSTRCLEYRPTTPMEAEGSSSSSGVTPVAADGDMEGDAMEVEGTATPPVVGQKRQDFSCGPRPQKRLRLSKLGFERLGIV